MASGYKLDRRELPSPAPTELRTCSLVLLVVFLGTGWCWAGWRGALAGGLVAAGYYAGERWRRYRRDHPR